MLGIYSSILAAAGSTALPVLFGCFQQDVRPHDVVASEGKGIAKGIVDVGLCRKMEHRIDVVGFKNVVH